MADAVNDTLTPDKGSTVGSLLAGGYGKVKSLISSATASFTGDTSAKAAGATTTSGGSFLTNPILWVGLVVVGAVVYFKKFRKPGRKAVNWKK